MSITSSITNTFPSTSFLISSLSPFSFPSTFLHQKPSRSSCPAIKTSSSQESYGPDLLRKPILSPPSDHEPEKFDGGSRFSERVDETESWVDWEDQILEDTVPLVGFVRMILHSGKYQSGDRLSEEHERTILERLLPYHPEYEKKVGCGVDYITVGYHPQFEDSRCLFVVRKDGELVDFSYWKCIKGFIRKNYPLYAESFIFKHFRRRKRFE